ncbi:hypothetical protein M3672_14905 [Microbacterium enclense]|uniref:hypothetical protein n=1 Tax=Microbacterium enclense TaxID=993073 RepID=UPI00203C7DA3|nr:hypothetical protein [Microbacterium enclense]MCM3615719.1 hypothetical protein [Microbacterium enclense]
MTTPFPDLPSIEELFDESPAEIVISEPPIDHDHAHLTLTEYAHKLAQGLVAEIDRRADQAEAAGNIELAAELREIR